MALAKKAERALYRGQTRIRHVVEELPSSRRKVTKIFRSLQFLSVALYIRILLQRTNRETALLGSLVYPLLDKGLSVYRLLG